MCLLRHHTVRRYDRHLLLLHSGPLSVSGTPTAPPCPCPILNESRPVQRTLRRPVTFLEPKISLLQFRTHCRRLENIFSVLRSLGPIFTPADLLGVTRVPHSGALPRLVDLRGCPDHLHGLPHVVEPFVRQKLWYFEQVGILSVKVRIHSVSSLHFCGCFPRRRRDGHSRRRPLRT